MFISTEATPNPSTLKFLPGREIHGAEPIEFEDHESAAARSPLAAALLSLGDVERVMIGRDFVSVTLSPGAGGWAETKADVLEVLADQLATGEPVVIDGDDDAVADDPADADIVAQIRELIDTRVRPAVAGDGGDIVYRGYHQGVVSLRMKGACSGCPSSSATLKHGIENLLKYYVPEVIEVRAV